MNMKKIVASIMAGTMLMGMASTANAATEISFWALSARQEAIDPIIEAFQAENEDIVVTASYFDTDGIKDACKVAASSDTLPSMWFNWGGSLGQFYVDNDKTYDLTEYAEQNGWHDKFSAGALNLCTLGGELSGYPTGYNVVGVFYNKEIFEECGVTVPTTFEEFEEVCAVIKEHGYTPMVAAGMHGWHVMRWVELLFEYYAGAELHDKMNSLEESWNNEAVINAFAKYQEWTELGYFPDGFVTADPNDTILPFGMGECAMDIQPQGYDNSFITNELDMNKYDVFAFPSAGTNRVSAFAEMTQFNAKLTEEELDACVKFMDYYCSEEVVAQYGEYYIQPLPMTGAKAPEELIHVDSLVAMSNENSNFTITDQAFPTEVVEVLFNAQDAIANGQMTPEEAAENLQNAVEKYQAK